VTEPPGDVERLGDVLDRSEVAGQIEGLLPTGGRPRQLSARTLLLGMLLTQTTGRPAHLTGVHRALITLDAADQVRLGVLAEWSRGPHRLTYRQVERTFALMVAALAKEAPDGEPSDVLCRIADAWMEASIPLHYAEQTSALAVDWSDLAAFATPPPDKEGDSSDPEASWGRRKSDAPGTKDELFFGYELQAATMVAEEHGPAVPELARRILVTSCHVDPPRAFVAVLARMAASGVTLTDVLADSGYAYRVPEHWALCLRALGANIVTDLHPSDRGQKGTFAGALCANGNLYCPAVPPALLQIIPLARSATKGAIDTHDQMTAEASRYKLGRVSADDADGFHRVACPAVMGKVRCPVREPSLRLSSDHPEVLDPPEHRPRCCSQQTVTVPPEVLAKTAQKHDYPSKAHRASYARRTAVERTFSTTKDRATNDMTRGWCRLGGVTAITLFAVATFVARNQRIVDAFEVRQADDERRRAAGLQPKIRRRRRRTLDDLVGVAPSDGPP
jgi:hypothetical protein